METCSSASKAVCHLRLWFVQIDPSLIGPFANLCGNKAVFAHRYDLEIRCYQGFFICFDVKVL